MEDKSKYVEIEVSTIKEDGYKDDTIYQQLILEEDLDLQAIIRAVNSNMNIINLEERKAKK